MALQMPMLIGIRATIDEEMNKTGGLHDFRARVKGLQVHSFYQTIAYEVAFTINNPELKSAPYNRAGAHWSSSDKSGGRRLYVGQN